MLENRKRTLFLLRFHAGEGLEEELQDLGEVMALMLDSREERKELRVFRGVWRGSGGSGWEMVEVGWGGGSGEGDWVVGGGLEDVGAVFEGLGGGFEG